MELLCLKVFYIVIEEVGSFLQVEMHEALLKEEQTLDKRLCTSVETDTPINQSITIVIPTCNEGIRR